MLQSKDGSLYLCWPVDDPEDGFKHTMHSSWWFGPRYATTSWYAVAYCEWDEGFQASHYTCLNNDSVFELLRGLSTASCKPGIVKRWYQCSSEHKLTAASRPKTISSWTFTSFSSTKMLRTGFTLKFWPESPLNAGCSYTSREDHWCPALTSRCGRTTHVNGLSMLPTALLPIQQRPCLAHCNASCQRALMANWYLGQRTWPMEVTCNLFGSSCGRQILPTSMGQFAGVWRPAPWVQ